MDWFFLKARNLQPQAWERMVEQLALAPDESLLARLHRGLNSDSFEDAQSCARAWRAWELALDGGGGDLSADVAPVDMAALVDKYRVQSHYLVHGCFWGERGLLCRAREVAGMPCVIVHGECDRVCRPQSALDLHAAIPGSQLLWVPGAGHDLYAPAMLDALGQAINKIETWG